MKRRFLNEDIMVPRGFLLWIIILICALAFMQQGMFVLLVGYSIVWALFYFLDWRDNHRALKAIKKQDQTHPWED